MLVGCLVPLVRLAPADQGFATLCRFVAAGVGIAAIGMVLSLSAWWSADWAAAVLRYYWFRLSDVMLPIGASLAGLILFARMQRDNPMVAAFTLCMGIVAVGSSIAAHHFDRTRDFRPASAIQQRPLAGQDAALARKTHDEWKQVCRWVDERTAADAMFLTPRYQQTFSWYANRPEVVNWKNVPQDATSLVAWRARFREVYSHLARREGFAALSPQRLQALCDKYEVDYVILDRSLSREPLSWKRVYPENRWEQSTFEVYRVPRP